MTQGSLGYGPHSLGHLANVGPSEVKFPLPFPFTLSVICLADKVNLDPFSSIFTTSFQTINPNLKQTKAAFMTLFTKLGVPSTKASFHCLESGSLSEQSAESLFTELGALHYTQWTGRLALGAEMTTKVQLCPPPKSFHRAKDFSVMSRELSHNLVIKAVLSRIIQTIQLIK